jgi:hypothetical protein
MVLGWPPSKIVSGDPNPVLHVILILTLGRLYRIIISHVSKSKKEEQS